MKLNSKRHCEVFARSLCYVKLIDYNSTIFIHSKLTMNKNQGQTMEYYYLALNGCASPTKHKSKLIYYKRTPFLGARDEWKMDVDTMESIIQNKPFHDGWLETDDFWVVNEIGRDSMRFKKACQICY